MRTDADGEGSKTGTSYGRPLRTTPNCICGVKADD